MCLRRTSKTSEKVGLDKERCMLNKITAKMLTSFFVYLSLWRPHNFPGCVCSVCVFAYTRCLRKCLQSSIMLHCCNVRLCNPILLHSLSTSKEKKKTLCKTVIKNKILTVMLALEVLLQIITAPPVSLLFYGSYSSLISFM